MSSGGTEEHPAVEPGSAASRRPGHELGAARERAGISLEEMATRLHLSRDSVEALERDDYEHLPTAAFVRGYLRAYAKEVGMDGDALVEEFDAVSGRTDEPELVLSEGVPDAGAGHGPTIAIVILVAVVVIGAGAWWFQQPTATPQAEPDASTMTGEGDPVDPDTGEQTSTPGAGSDTEAETAAEADASATGTDAGTTAVAQVEDAATEQVDGAESGGTGADADVPASSDSDADASAQDAAGTENVVAEAPASDGGDDVTGADTAEAETGGPLATSDAELAASSAAASGPDQLEITVDGESWIEVHDSRGRRLAYTLYSGSSPVVLNGWAPFDVILGNSPVVTVRLGGQVVDKSAFERSDNSARFLADSEGARRR
jgi:cytoskeleton protein RodZ